MSNINGSGSMTPEQLMALAAVSAARTPPTPKRRRLRCQNS